MLEIPTPPEVIQAQRRRNRRIRLLVASCLYIVLVIYRWEVSQPNNDGSWSNVLKNQTLRVGMDASYAPFATTPNGIPDGLDVDIANEIGKRLGVKIQIVNMGFDGLYDSLRAGQVDVLISALSVDPTKFGYVTYTESYFNAGQVLVSRDGHYKRMEDLEGRTVAVEYGTIADDVTRQWQRRLHLLNTVRLTTSQEALAEVYSGKVDAALVDHITARLYLRSTPGLVISQQPVTNDFYCVGTRAAAPDLAAAISDVIRDMRNDGTLARLLAKWL